MELKRHYCVPHMENAFLTYLITCMQHIKCKDIYYLQKARLLDARACQLSLWETHDVMQQMMYL